MQISSNGTTLYLDEAALRYTIEAGGSLWQWQCFYEPYFICESDGSERTVRLFRGEKNFTQNVYIRRRLRHYQPF